MPQIAFISTPSSSQEQETSGDGTKRCAAQRSGSLSADIPEVLKLPDQPHIPVEPLQSLHGRYPQKPTDRNVLRLSAPSSPPPSLLFLEFVLRLQLLRFQYSLLLQQLVHGFGAQRNQSFADIFSLCKIHSVVEICFVEPAAGEKMFEKE